MEFSLLTAAALGLGGLYATLWFEAGRGNAAECTRELWDVALTAAIVGLGVGRIGAMIGDGVNPLTSPQDLIVIRAGVATGPAALAALAWTTWVARRRFAEVADGLAAAALAGLAAWHGACLVRGACLGTPTSLPWGQTQPGSTISRHPVELYAAAAFAVGAIVLALAKRRHLPPGVPAGLALAVAGGVRLVTEPLRPSLDGGPVGWYVAAIAGGLAVVGWALGRAARSRSSASPG